MKTDRSLASVLSSSAILRLASLCAPPIFRSHCLSRKPLPLPVTHHRVSHASNCPSHREVSHASHCPSHEGRTSPQKPGLKASYTPHTGSPHGLSHWVLLLLTRLAVWFDARKASSPSGQPTWSPGRG